MEKALEKIDFTIGREIEVGGVYKGIVTSVKEYGAFVEFNGGQHGLLHISELSHEPVSQVSDVVSVGQQLNLICIGQDVRGNIKLSLKKTLPHPKSGPTEVVDRSPADVQEKPTEQPLSKCEVKKRNVSSVPSFLIRSAEECDEQEASSCLNKNDSDDKPELLNSLGLSRDSKSSTAVSAKNMKIGTRVTAKVYQIRARGLVLDLGDGLKGMFRFESNNGKAYKVGDEMRVECSSFSSKGVPVMSL